MLGPALRWTAWLGLVGAGGLMGTAGAGLGTDAGRAALVDFGLGFANRALRGTVAVGGSEGSPLRGIVLHDVSVADTAGRPVLHVAGLSVRYRVRDLLRGRFVLGQLLLDRPALRLERAPDGRWNVEEVLRLGEGGGGGPRPLIAFQDVEVDGATIVIADGARRTVAMDSVRLRYLRLSSPLPGQDAIRAEIRSAALTLSDPAVTVADLAGSVDVHGDSLVVEGGMLRLAGSSGTVTGWLVPGGDVRFDLRVDAERLAVQDLAAFTGSLPTGVRTASGRARVRLARRAPGSLTVEADGVALTPGDGGSITGRVAVSTGPGGRWALTDTDLRTASVSLDLLRAFVDTVPMVGRLTGRTRAAGPAEHLAIRVDWRFEDTAVVTRPVTTIEAEGDVSLGGDAGVAFLDLGVRRATVALATVERLVPAVALRGTMDGAGTLSGPWRDATFSGTLRHRDGVLPATTARGVVRLDTRDTIVVVEADLGFDSLATDGIRPSYPALGLAGSYAGDARVAGPLTGFELTLDLAGPRGAFRGSAHVSLGDSRKVVDRLDLAFRDATVDALEARFPDTRLTGSVRGSVAFDTLLAAMDLEIALAPSAVAAVPLDSLRGRVATTGGRLRVDTLLVWAAHLRAEGRGALGLASEVRDSVRLVLQVDSVADLLPLVARYTGDPRADWLPDTVAGSLRLTTVLAGRLGAVDVALVAEGRDLRWEAVTAPAATARWSRTVGGDTRALLLADSVGAGDLGFGSVSFALSGDRARQPFQVRGRLGDYAAVLAGGVLEFDSARFAVRLDSLAVLAERARDALEEPAVWFLERPGRIAVSDSAVRFDDIALAPPSGASRIAVAGTLPRKGGGALAVSVEAVRLDQLWAVLQRDPDLAAGELSGTLSLGGTARAPEIDGSLALREGVFGEFRAPYVESSLAYRDRRMTGTVRLFRLGEEVLSVTIELPIDLALRDAPPRRRLPGALSIRARASEVDLALLDAISPAVRRTSGRFSADLGITGTWERPELTGYLSISDGAASFPAIGVRHERLNARLALAGDSIRLERFTLASGNGTAEVLGAVRLEELTQARLNLAIHATDFRAIDVQDLVQATVSGDVQLTGPLFAATLTGRGTIPRGVVWFADIVEKDIINLEDTIYAPFLDRELLRRQGLGAEFESRFLDSLTISGLQLSMGNDVWLRSNEANIQLAGDVTVGKTEQRYRLDGTLATPRGTYRLQLIPLVEGFEREFTVTRGAVQYFGTADLDAALDVDARHVVRTQRGDNLTVFVHIGGTVYAPTLTLSSDHRPTLSDTEIISYLLVGAPSVAAAGSAGRQVGEFGEGFAEAIAARLVSSGATSVITDLGVPIDYFEIRPEFALGSRTMVQGASVSIGRRLSDRVFLTVNPRICTNQRWDLHNLGFGLEYRLSRVWRFSVAADPLGACSLFGSEQSTLRYQLGLDLLWETSY